MGRGPGVSKTEEVRAEAGWKKRPGCRAGEWTGQARQQGGARHRVTLPRKARPCLAAAVSVGASEHRLPWSLRAALGLESASQGTVRWALSSTRCLAAAALARPLPCAQESLVKNIALSAQSGTGHFGCFRTWSGSMAPHTPSGATLLGGQSPDL